MTETVGNLESQAGICGCDVIQELIGILADEWFFVVASCWRDEVISEACGGNWKFID